MKKLFRIILYFVIITLASVLLVYTIIFTISRLRSPVKPTAFYQSISSPFSIIAHQAGEGEYPSNSMIGFLAAHNAGVEILDTDIFESKDQHIVLFHDADLDYRTDIKGAIKDKTLTELQQANIGYNWTPDNGKTYPYRSSPIHIVTAEQLFTSFPNSLFNIEIKQVDKGSVTRFCELLKQLQMTDRVLVSSNPDNPDSYMQAFRSNCPTVSTVALKSEVKQFYTLHRLGLAGLFKPKFSALQVPEKSGSTLLLTPSFINDAHRIGVKVYPWTIESIAEAQRFKNMGADGVISSYPELLMSASL